MHYLTIVMLEDVIIQPCRSINWRIHYLD